MMIMMVVAMVVLETPDWNAKACSKAGANTFVSSMKNECACSCRTHAQMCVCVH